MVSDAPMPDADSNPSAQESLDGGSGGSALDLGSKSFESLCGKLASGKPTPGAGSGAAAVAALGASLVSMAFRCSSSEGSSVVPAYMGGRADELNVLTHRLQQLIDQDAQAFEEFLKVRKSDVEGEAARAKWQAALKSAACSVVEVPFAILEVSLSALRLAAVGAPDQNPNLVCETETGALALWAAMEACERIVRDNLPIAAAQHSDFAEDHERVLPVLMKKGAELLAEVRAATALRQQDAM
ncbi:MAG: formiminotetrahydrofolate cyclodeaminase [Planctomycetota bacterium]|jgi:formiminotetrahydrofolate cyclodeaminase